MKTAESTEWIEDRIEKLEKIKQLTEPLKNKTRS